MPQERKEGVDWEHIKKQWKRGIALRKIADDNNITRHAIMQMRDREEWREDGRQLARIEQRKIKLIEHEVEVLKVYKTKSKGAQKVVADALSIGMAPKDAARLIGMDSTKLNLWRQQDPAFNDLCMLSVSDFISKCLTTIAESIEKGNASTAFKALETNPLTRDTYGPTIVDHNTLNIQLSFKREDLVSEDDYIDATCQEIPADTLDAPQKD